MLAIGVCWISVLWIRIQIQEEKMINKNEWSLHVFFIKKDIQKKFQLYFSHFGHQNSGSGSGSGSSWNAGYGSGFIAENAASMASCVTCLVITGYRYPSKKLHVFCQYFSLVFCSVFLKWITAHYSSRLSSHPFQEKQCPREITFFSKPFTSCSGALTIFIAIKEKEFHFHPLAGS